MADSTPSSAPAEAPKVTTPAPAEKITLDAKDKLADLKSILAIKTTDPGKEKEIAEIEEFFKQKQDEILTISKTSIASLKRDIEDANETLTVLKVKDGELVHTEVQSESAPPTPEVSKPAESTSEEVAAAVTFFKEEGEFVDTNTEPPENLGIKMVKWLRDMISSFFISLKEMFGQDVSNERAHIEGFKDALSKRKVEGMISGLRPYMGGVLDKASVAKKEGLANYIEGAGIPLIFTSENGQQQIMVAPQIMKYVFEGKDPDGKLSNIIKNDETWENIQAARGKYLSQAPGDHADISAIDRVKEIFTVGEEDEKQSYINRAKQGVEPVAGVASASGPTPPEIQKAQETTDQKETEGTSESPSLDPFDEKHNLLYNPQQGKLYQSVDGIFKEIGYVNKTLGLAGNILEQQGSAIQDTRLTTLSERGYKVIPYSQANTIVQNMDQNRKVESGGWLWVSPEYFAGKLRNIKID